MSTEGRNIASVLIGVILVFFIGGVLLGNLESVITDMQVTGMSVNFNNTVDDLITYSWVGMGLAILSVLIVSGAFILRQTNLM